MGWYASSTGEVREAEDYPAPAFWVRLPDPEHAPGSEFEVIVAAVPGPFWIVGVPVRLVGGRWESAGEVAPMSEWRERAAGEGEEVVDVWHKDGVPTDEP